MAADRPKVRLARSLARSLASARCDLLLSEDLQDGFAWRGVTVTNPFGSAPDPRIVNLLT